MLPSHYKEYEKKNILEAESKDNGNVDDAH